MECPLCNTTAGITSNVAIKKEGKFYNRLTFACRNKNCENFAKEIGHEDVEFEVVDVEE